MYADVLEREETQVESPTYDENKEALALWYRVVLEGVQKDSYDLSARQQALLLTLNAEFDAHTVRGLAAHMKVSKAAITRALNTLSAHGLIERLTDQKDRRNVFIVLTDEGKTYLKKLSGRIMNCLVEID